MAPLDSYQRPAVLVGSARKAEFQLNRFRQQALKRKSGRREASKQILEDAVSDINKSIGSLKAWSAELSKGTETTDKNVLITTNGYFVQLEKRIAIARKALDNRFGLRSWFLSLNKKDEARARLKHALTEIAVTIGSLQSQLKTVIVDSQDQQQRITRIDHISKRSRSYYVFREDLGRMSSAERRTTRFGFLPCLWEELPARPNWAEHIGSSEDPGDGRFYDTATVDQAHVVLKDFYEAWSESAAQLDPAKSTTSPRVEPITKMPKICLVLKGMRQERLVDYFSDKGVTDVALPLTLDKVCDILPKEDLHHGNIFFAEQHRVTSRKWDDGDHITIPDEEPLPLLWQNDYGSGSFGTVKRYKCVFTNAYFARKEQNSQKSKAHLKREVDRLQKVKHLHIVQFVKSYERGDCYGILLRPAATTDLKKLMTKRYAKNGYYRVDDGAGRRRDRTVFKPIILTAFGCLSRGLAHIHSCNVRHRDVKPENILYEKENSENPPRFLWADFGLAHYFVHGDSKTANPSHYSPRYAAPETVKSTLDLTNTDSVPTDTTHLQVEGPEVGGSHDGSSDRSRGGQPIIQGHGRSTDIFSFGCVFLETLSHLMDEKRGKLDRAEFEACDPFHQNIEKLQDWARTEGNALGADDPMRLLFELGIWMISREPTSRPKIHDIVTTLEEANPLYFCELCQNELKERKDEQKDFLHLDPGQQALRPQISIEGSMEEPERDPDPDRRKSFLQDLEISKSSTQQYDHRRNISESSTQLRPNDIQPLKSALRNPDNIDPNRPKSTPRFGTEDS